MKTFIGTIITGFAAASLPFVASAQGARDVGDITNNLGDVAVYILDFINNILVPLVFAIAFLVFIWGLFYNFIAKAEKREEGKSLMLWGIVAFFVMVSVWGLVNILVGTFELDSDNLDNIPEVPEQRDR